uniref:Helicase ATP-binding domain-containing protein n=1 Tax=viral metagenome TaxID=1070528 RepID=A0A6C0FAQ4_9ZZZZ
MPSRSMTQETVWETVDRERFSVFIRDLSQSVNTNLKHMIEDSEKSLPNPPRNNSKKKKKLSKKEQIIMQNTQRLHQKHVDRDKQTIRYLLDNFQPKTPYEGFIKLHTKEAKQEYKVRLLDLYWNHKHRKKYIHHIINLCYHLKRDELSLTQQETLDMIRNKLRKYDLKSYMLDKMGHLLPPLNFWDHERKLDEWQKDVIARIRNRESILVKAPTSAGKTFVAMSTGVLHQKVLYVCPAKPVAYQVGSAFVKMGYRVHYLVNNHCENSYDKQTNIFVGVPETIEECLPKIGLKYDYAVFDEIHTLDDPNTGLSYENLIKLLDCPCLALSATIGNIEFLRDMFQKYHSHPIHYVEYTTRFINQQRWVYDSDNTSLRKLHPIVSLDTDSPESFLSITMTASDCSKLYTILSETFEDNSETEDIIEKLDPDEYFPEDRLLTLDDVKQWESSLKQTVVDLTVSNKSKIQEIQNGCQKEYPIKDTLEDLVPLLQTCQTKDLLPMLYFHTHEDTVKEIYLHLDESLRNKEMEKYPYHYHILEQKESYYQEYLKKRDVFEGNIKIKGSKDAMTDKQAKLERYDREQKMHYMMKVRHLYEWCIHQCDKHEVLETTIRLQKEHLKRDKERFTQNPDFRSQDVFQKHPEFCFVRGDPMSGDEIRNIKRNLRNSTGQTLDYTHPLFQLLKRGIGVYLHSFPDEYNRVVQTLLSQKKLGVVLSDKTLCLGIDLPIRTVAFSGYKQPDYTTSDYLQMSGRAGRRGHDNQGNIIFHHVSNYKQLMRGELPQLKGSSQQIHVGYNALQQLLPDANLQHIHTSRINLETNPLLNQIVDYTDNRYTRLEWLCRNYENGHAFISQLHKLEKQVFRQSEHEREEWLLSYLISQLGHSDRLINVLKTNRIDRDQTQTLQELHTLGECMRHMIRNLNQIQCKLTITHLQHLFQKIRTIVTKYRFE